MNHRNLWAAAFCAIAAIAACRPAVGADFAFAAEAVKQGDLLLKKDDFDGAISAYAAAIRLDPKLAEAYYNRGLAYEKKGEQAKAEGDFAQAKKLGYKTREKKGYPPYPGDYDSLFPNSTQAIRPGVKCGGHYDRGGASLRKGDLDKAFADFAEAFRLNPKRAEACYGRAANEEEFAAPLKMQPIPPQIIAAGRRWPWRHPSRRPSAGRAICDTASPPARREARGSTRSPASSPGRRRRTMPPERRT